MFGISGTELIIILFFGFLILGPEKLPQVGRTVGRAIRQFRDASEVASKKFKEEVADPFQEAIAPYKDQMDESTKPIQEDIAAISDTFKEAQGMFTDPFKDILSPGPTRIERSETAVVTTTVAEDPFEGSLKSDAGSSAKSEDASADDTASADDAASADDIASSADTSSDTALKRTIAASLYDLDDEDGE